MAEQLRSEPQDIRERIYAEQVKYLYSNAAAGLLTTYINSTVLAYILWPVVNAAGLFLWVGMLWVFTTLRYLLIHRHRQAMDRADYTPRLWGWRFAAGMLVAGLLWGCIVFLAFPANLLPQQIFIAFVIGGMAAGASSSLAYLYSVPILFNVSAMLPVIGRLLYEASEIQYAMAIMMTLFLAMMLVFARRSHDMFVSTVMLGYEKGQLLNEYERTRDDLQVEVTGREQAEASLRDSQTRLRTIIDHAPFIIYALDQQGRFVLSEGMGLAAQNLKPGELVGSSCYTQFADEPELLATIDKAMQGQHTTCLRQKEGRLYDVICTPMFAERGGIIGIIGIETDVTEKLKMERMRSDLISTVSHELRTPLTSIVGSLQLIQSGVIKDPPRHDELIDTALRNSKRLIRLVNDILDVDKLQSGKMQFNMQDYELKGLLEQAVTANQSYADKFAVHLKLEKLDNTRVYVDEERFQQVMANLISNAVKHSPQDGTVSLRVGRIVRPQETGMSPVDMPSIRIMVVDNGPGIPVDHRGLIFEKFTQIDAEKSLVQGGTGLGLSIAKSIVEQMDGDIGFEVDELKHETRFYFILPEWRSETPG